MSYFIILNKIMIGENAKMKVVWCLGGGLEGFLWWVCGDGIFFGV
jgi:hypothetical protein